MLSLTTNQKLEIEFNKLLKEVLKKNDDYGDSLHNPLGVFQKDILAGVLGRIDDKLNRIKTVGINDKTEDTIGDLIGYLFHLKIILKNSN